MPFDYDPFSYFSYAPEKGIKIPYPSRWLQLLRAFCSAGLSLSDSGANDCV